MRLDGEDGYVSFVRAIRPEQSPRRGRIVFQIGLENLNPVFAGQVVNFVRSQTWMSRVLAQERQRFHQLLEKFLPLLVQLALLPARREVVPERLHLRQPHPDVESHSAPHSSRNEARSIGADACPFFKWATDLLSIFNEREEMACGGTNTRGSSR